MALAAELQDFSTVKDSVDRSFSKAKKDPDSTNKIGANTGGLGARASIFGAPTVEDHKNKGYSYSKGGLVRAKS